MSLTNKNHSLSQWKKGSLPGTQGMSLPEVGITVAVIGILAAVAAPTLTAQTNNLNSSMNLVEGNFKVARSKAMSQTKSYRIKPNGTNQFVMEQHASGAGSSIYSCDDAELETDSNGKSVWTVANGFNADEDMALQDGVQIKSVTVDGTALSDLTDWSLCFDARGMANKNIVLTLEETDSGNLKTLEVFSGGSLIAYDTARFNEGASSPSGASTSTPGANVAVGAGNSSPGASGSTPGAAVAAGAGSNSPGASGSTPSAAVAAGAGSNSPGASGSTPSAAVAAGAGSSNPGASASTPGTTAAGAGNSSPGASSSTPSATSTTASNGSSNSSNSNSNSNSSSSNSNSNSSSSNSNNSDNSNSSNSNSNNGSNNNGNNGHGNNCDGVDSSNPGKGKGGPNGAVDPSGTVDDECKKP